MPELELFDEPAIKQSLITPEPKTCGTCGAFVAAARPFCELSCLDAKKDAQACDWHYPRVDKSGAGA
jgi:hypothetical protein